LSVAVRTALVAATTAGLVLLSGLPAGAATVPVTPAPVTSADRTAQPAAADSAVLRERVDALTAQLEALEVEAEVAIEAWNETRAELDALVAAEVEAQIGLDGADRAMDTQQGAATRRVRALYRSGGNVELAWTALSGAGFTQAATTYRTARTVLDADAAAVLRSRDQVDVAVESSSRVQLLRRARARLEALAGTRSADAEAALLATTNLLAGTDAALVEAVERERQEAERAALAEAMARAQERARAEAAAAAVAAEVAATAGSTGTPGWPPSPSGSTGATRSPETGASGGTVRPGSVGTDQQQVLERAAAAAPSPAAAAAVRAAATRLGLPYVWGATGPGTFDCSGLTMWSYRQAGVNIPRTSRQQYSGLPRVPVSRLLPGDLVFWADGASPSSIHHVAMYLGDGLMIQAPKAGDVVKISAVWSRPMFGAVRAVG